jgi:hypothetical protein
LAHTVRINYDQTLTPTLMLHLGAGVMTLYNPDDATYSNFDALKELGLKGTYSTRFPYITGLAAGQGGMAAMGPNQQWRNWFVLGKSPVPKHPIPNRPLEILG